MKRAKSHVGLDLLGFDEQDPDAINGNNTTHYSSPIPIPKGYSFPQYIPTSAGTTPEPLPTLTAPTPTRLKPYTDTGTTVTDLQASPTAGHIVRPISALATRFAETTNIFATKMTVIKSLQDILVASFQGKNGDFEKWVDQLDSKSKMQLKTLIEKLDRNLNTHLIPIKVTQFVHDMQFHLKNINDKAAEYFLGQHLWLVDFIYDNKESLASFQQSYQEHFVTVRLSANKLM